MYSFEFLVLCIGKYGDVPLIPAFPKNKGQEMYDGKVLHSIDYSKLDKEETTHLLKGKKVAIVGYKKSAIELAIECAHENQGIIHVYIYIYIYKGTRKLKIKQVNLQD